MDARVLRSAGPTPSAVALLTHSNSATQYLITRLVLEYKIRPTSKLACILLTSIHPLAAGGIGGLVLRLAQDGHGQLQVIGPRGSAACFHALRHIFRWRHPKIFVSDCSEKNTPVFEDEFVVITPLISGTFHRCPCCVARKEPGSWRVNSQQVPELDEDSNPVFWNEHGRLQEISGEALGDGEQGWTRTLLGFTCFIKELDAALVVLDISDPSLLIGLETMFQCEQHRRGIAAVIHLSPKPVIKSQAYASWTENSHSFHVLANAGSPKFGFKASLKTFAKLNLVDEKFFPLPRHNECSGVSSEAGFLSRVVLEKRCSGVLVRMDHSGCSSNFNVEEFQNNLLDRKPGIRDRILSQKQTPEQQWSSNQLAAAALRQNLLRGREKRASLPELVNEFELLFLGTVSAEPSKYRGSSGILLRIGESSMLLDAGEGVLGQISRDMGRKILTSFSHWNACGFPTNMRIMFLEFVV